MFALTILLVQANSRRAIRAYTLRGQVVSDFIRFYFLFLYLFYRLVISLKMSSLTHSEAENSHLYLLHKSQQILSLMHEVENHSSLHSVNFLIFFFHLI